MALLGVASGDGVAEWPQEQVVEILEHFFGHSVISIGARRCHLLTHGGIPTSMWWQTTGAERGVDLVFFLFEYLMFQFMYLDVSLVKLKCCCGVFHGVSFFSMHLDVLFYILYQNFSLYDLIDCVSPFSILKHFLNTC